MSKVDDTQSVAVIGMAGRFPQANNVESFWRNLANSVESVSFFTKTYLEDSHISNDLLDNNRYVPAGVILENVEMFDAAFFGISPREAAIMDPQQRLLLETAYEVFEHAAYNSEQFKGLIGVYTACDPSSYLINNILPNEKFNEISNNLLLTYTQNCVATQIAYRLNLQGPCIDVNTACSSSLVAIHLACRSLIYYECDMALTGGAAINTAAIKGYLHEPGSILSPDGHCRVFDAKAQGTIAGSGIGLLLLKRLNDALADGDTIYAIIRGSAINNDGSNKVGYTAPSIQGQQKVIQYALDIAGISPASIGYIECHGTGTTLGDPIELTALAEVFKKNDYDAATCYLGSVKSNIGHLSAAAGVAGTIKTIQSLRNKQIPPILHFQSLNPEINLSNSNLCISDKLINWETNHLPRRAGVSSFGIGGTNAHIILEEAPAMDVAVENNTNENNFPHLLLLSAKSSIALKAKKQQLANYLTENSNIHLRDAAFTLQNGRIHYNFRQSFVCRTINEAINQLQNEGNDIAEAKHTNAKLVMVFPSTGYEYINMARDLYYQEPNFALILDKCCQLIKNTSNENIIDILYPEQDADELSLKLLQQSKIVQPILFSIQFALATVLIEWGLVPTAFLGYGIGECVAACLSGVFSLEDAIQLILYQSKLIDQTNMGVTLTEPILTEDMIYLKTIKLNTCKIPFISSITGTWISNDQATSPDYWVEQLRTSVRISDGMQQILQLDNPVLIEVGPGNLLDTMIIEQLADDKKLKVYKTLPLNSEINAYEFILKNVSNLWDAGLELNWEKINPFNGRRIALPTYPFERKRFWIDPPIVKEFDPSRSSVHINESAATNSTFDRSVLNNQYLAPSTDIEEELAQLWTDVLGIKVIGITDNFFELGGHSLFATQLITRVFDKYGVRITLQDFFDNPTINGLVESLLKSLLETTDKATLNEALENINK